ncbi:thermonuclease family protein [Risungbinella massiliensis]|uniref:thermonuclease family protein n=1 Tax=Risungbinella massiliensis TaxID=1329796 RepID=UPI00069AE39A|nr:thermonuclease family protein [Risungbinella massiliensis]
MGKRQNKTEKRNRRAKMKQYFKPLHTVAPQNVTVVDGDTVKFSKDGHTFYVRLIGINAPELNLDNSQSPQPFSIEAKERLGQLLLDAKDVKISLHPNLTDDTQNRLLGHLHVNLKGQYMNVSHVLLSEGLAVPYKIRRGLTKVERMNYDLLAYEAQRHRIGVHSIPGYVTEDGKFDENKRAV